MGKFKAYLMKEGLGLGNLGSKISSALNSQWLDAKVGGAMTSSDMTGSDTANTWIHSGHPLFAPSTDLTIPQTVRTGRIVTIDYQNDPILVHLSDGTDLPLSYDVFNKIKGEPKVGKLMTVTFQRHPDDVRPGHSKIERIEIRD